MTPAHVHFGGGPSVVAKSSKSKASEKAHVEEAEIADDAVEVSEPSQSTDMPEIEDAVRADEVLDVTEEAVPETAEDVELGDTEPADESSEVKDVEALELEEFETPEIETAEADVAPKPAPPTPEPEPKKSGFVPLLLGGVIAAGLGYAVPTYLMPQENAAVVALQGQVAALETSVAEADARAAEAQGQAQTASDAAAAIVVPDVAPLEQTAADLTAQLAQLEARIAALEARPVGDDSGITEGDFANLRALLAEQQATSAALTADMQRMASLQAEGLANAETEALNAARAAQRAAALQVVRTALETGEPFETALDTLENVPDALSAVAADGVATAESLQDAFPDLSRASLAAARAAAAEGDAAGSILAFVQKQVGARSVIPREGDDPDAVLSRAEAAVRAADWGTALTEIAALPEAAQAPLAEWQTAAQTRAAATTALSDFEAAN